MRTVCQRVKPYLGLDVLKIPNGTGIREGELLEPAVGWRGKVLSPTGAAQSRACVECVLNGIGEENTFPEGDGIISMSFFC